MQNNGVQKTFKTLLKPWFRAIVVAVAGPLRQGLSVQIPCDPMENLVKTMLPHSGQQFSVYVQLVHGHESHGSPKTLENLWEINVPGMLAEHK